MSEKLYLCRWGRLNTKTYSTGHYNVSEDHFKLYRGYTEKDIKDILNLSVKEEWFDGDGKRIGEHSVLRIK